MSGRWAFIGRAMLAAACAWVGAAVLASAASAAPNTVVKMDGVQVVKSGSIDLSAKWPQPSVAVPGTSVQGWPLRQLVSEVERTNAKVKVADFTAAVTVQLPQKKSFSVSKDKLISGSDDQLPIFFVDSEDDEFLSVWIPGRGSIQYDKLTSPVVVVPVSRNQTTVSIDPSKRFSVKPGGSQTFRASVSSGAGATTFTWTVQKLDKPSIPAVRGTGPSFVYKFEKSGQYMVKVEILTGSSALVNVDVPKEKAAKKKKKKKQEKQEEPADNSSDPYDYGYGGSYGDGSGTGYPSTGGSPNPSPKTPKEKKSESPVDNGLDTVTGQLVDPSQIAAVVPSGNPATEEQPELEPEEVKSGGIGISDGAMTAIGVGALLGLGGLAEAGAFAGLRRFRLRP